MTNDPRTRVICIHGQSRNVFAQRMTNRFTNWICPQW